PRPRTDGLDSPNQAGPTTSSTHPETPPHSRNTATFEYRRPPVGLPRQARTEADPPDSKMHVVYAHGHGYGTHWNHGPPLGDDFVEYLPLTESFGEDGAAFIDTLRGPDTAAWLVITVYPNTFSVELSDTGPS
ncbi:hypothetical protein, partial [Nocardia barduliensis]|uniref:hypothetical protein n=2 Tax=Nocardia TaxID=1817 RepID=UPI001C2D3A57